jgi:glycosyltransferase involved in cell wall biosynthesis
MLGNPPGELYDMANKFFIWQGTWRGGAERVTLSMAYFLAAQGESVTLGVFQKNDACPLPQMIFSRPPWIPDSFQSMAASLRFAWRYAPDFDAVYTHTPWLSRKTLIFVHDAADLDAYLAATRGWLPRLAARIWHVLYLQLCLKRATHIFAATEEMKKYLRRHGVAADRIQKSASFYDPKVFFGRRRSHPVPPYHLIFIGNPEDPRKNFQLLQTTMYAQADYELSIYGGTKRYQDRNFTYYAYADSTTLAQALHQAHVFVLPSISEGFSIALLEALASGIPCLVANTAIPSELKDFINLISFASSPELVARLQYLLAHYPQYNKSDPRIARYEQEYVLRQEYVVMKQAIASSVTHDTASL